MDSRCFRVCWALLALHTEAAEMLNPAVGHVRDEKACDLPTLVPDPEQRELIQKAFETSAQNGYLIRDTRDKTLVQVFLQLDCPPTDLAFDVSLRSGNHSWRVGPMAWKKGEIKWWAYDLDLPEAVDQVDIVFTPSARAGMLLSRFPVWPVKGLKSIWSGDAFVVPKVGIRTQDISLMGERPPGDEEAREHLMDALPPDGEPARQVAAGMSLGDIRKLLEAQAARPNAVPEVGFAFGSVMLAQGRLDEAMATLVKSRGDTGLEDRIQRELRFICERWLDGARANRLADMFSLGRAYEEGNGVGQDFQQAKYWYRKAANAGHLESKARLAEMAPLLQNGDEASKKMLADYRKQAAEWHMTSSTGYQDWVKRYARESFQSLRTNGNAAELKLIVTQVGGEVVGQLDQEARLSETLQVFELFADGKGQSYYQSSMGTKGGDYNPCPPDKLPRLNQLIAALPEDHGVLPPANRRLLIETGTQTEHLAHAYDRANAPPEIGELMSLLYIPTYVPSFEAKGSIHVGRFEFDGALAVSPQSEILYTGSKDYLQWWDPATHEFLAETKVDHVKSIVFAPDKIHALVQSSDDTLLIDLLERKPVQTFKDVSRARFTQNGKQLLLFGKNGALKILDSRTWEPVGHADGVPRDCTSFIPAASIHRAIVRAADGSVSLWDTLANRSVKQLSPDSEVTMLADFSPDQALFAYCPHPWLDDPKEGILLGIFSSDTGKLIHELSGNLERFQSLLWTPDGAYVLATSEGTGVNVFNATNGKLSAKLTGPTRINGMGLLNQSGELVVGDQHGRIWFWDLPAVVAMLREFEASLTTAER